MLIFLLLCLLAGGFFIELIQKLFSRKEDLDWDELWLELSEEDWFKKLLENAGVKEWIESDKKHGLLQDPYYIRKIIDTELHREIFITYVSDKTRLNRSG